jgi:hypothetical protein
MSNIEDELPVQKTPKSKKISALVRNAIKAQAPSEDDDDVTPPATETKPYSTPQITTNTDDEPQFSKLAKAQREYDDNVVPHTPIKVSKAYRTPKMATNTQEVTEPQLTTTSQIPTGRTCPGCYHCNWAGVNPEGYGCTMHYYGSQN